MAGWLLAAGWLAAGWLYKYTNGWSDKLLYIPIHDAAKARRLLQYEVTGEASNY